MNDFNLNRFLMVLRLDLAVGRRQLMVYTAGGVMVYLFYFWFAYNIGMHAVVVNDMESYVNHICEAVAMFGVMTMYMFFLVVASTLWRHEQPKAGRTMHLMLPATPQEKFLSRWVYMLVLSVTAGCLTFFVADALHIVWLWLTDKPVVAATAYFLKAFKTDFSQGAHSLYSILIAVHAFFLLGGVVLRKFHFVLTAIAAFMLFPSMMYFLTTDQPYMKSVPILWWHAGVAVLFAVLTCVFTVAAYRIYCRWQVVTHKLLNR
jgi:hypothetical protein